jgi:Mg/Co/Ni transporter MgtE
MFEGMDLSEEFKNKVTLVFEAAVNEAATTKANAMAEEYAAKVDQEMQESVDSTVNTIIENLDSYLDYVVEEWMKENELAIEAGIKVEMAESLMNGLKELFEEHNIEVDDETVDVVA